MGVPNVKCVRVVGGKQIVEIRRWENLDFEAQQTMYVRTALQMERWAEENKRDQAVEAARRLLYMLRYWDAGEVDTPEINRDGSRRRAEEVHAMGTRLVV